MTETTTKRRGGRPPLPEHIPVIDSATCRIAWTRETMRPGGGRERQLRDLARLHKAFLVGEAQAMEQRRVVALEGTAKSKAELVAIKRQEYLRRFATTELGARSLLQQVAKLQERIKELEAQLNSGTLPTPEGSGVYES